MMRSGMQPLVRPSEELINLHTFGLKRGVPSELLGQSGINRVRQQEVFREALPYWVDPSLMYEKDEDGHRMRDTAQRLRSEWLTGRPTWGLDKNPAEKQEHYLNLRDKLMPYSINALGPFTALDSTEYMLQWMKGLGGAFLSISGQDEHLAPDWEENFWRPTLDMMFPHQKEALQQFLMTMGWDAGGHHKGGAVRVRPGELAMKDSMFGLEIWPDEETGIPMAKSMDVFLYRMLPVIGTELPGLMGAAWGDNYSMQKWAQDPNKFGDMSEFMKGMSFFFGKWGGYKQQYPFDPKQTVSHRIRDVQKAASVAQGYRERGYQKYPSGQFYPTPADIELIEQAKKDED